MARRAEAGTIKPHMALEGRIRVTVVPTLALSRPCEIVDLL